MATLSMTLCTLGTRSSGHNREAAVFQSDHRFYCVMQSQLGVVAIIERQLSFKVTTGFTV